MKKLVITFVVILGIGVALSAIAAKVGGGDIVFKPKNAKKVTFSHEYHVNIKGLRCTGCHYKIFEMSKGSYKIDMSKITKGEFCGFCHNGRKAFDVNDAAVCSRCHK